MDDRSLRYPHPSKAILWGDFRMTDKQNVAEMVARFRQTTYGMQSGEQGNWVLFTDYEALAARLAEVEADRDRWVKNASDIAKDYEATLVERDRLREERDELDFILHEGGDDSVANLIAERDRLREELDALIAAEEAAR
jgi:hypothetical protein